MNIEIRNASMADSRLLFDWSNDPLTRANSFSSDGITWEGHIKWLSGKLRNPDTSMYIFYIEKIPVGIVRFDTGSETVVGVTVAPEYRGKGISSNIIGLGCLEFWKANDNEVNAYIKEDNIASYKAFEKAGFKFKKKDLYNSIPCIILYKKKNG
jgi:UDP-2,4-diacetamido-2,4,6-trideoxy-beta-L-altropyranose hydrolase